MRKIILISLCLLLFLVACQTVGQAVGTRTTFYLRDADTRKVAKISGEGQLCYPSCNNPTWVKKTTGRNGVFTFSRVNAPAQARTLEFDAVGFDEKRGHQVTKSGAQLRTRYFVYGTDTGAITPITPITRPPIVQPQ